MVKMLFVFAIIVFHLSACYCGLFSLRNKFDGALNARMQLQTEDRSFDPILTSSVGEQYFTQVLDHFGNGNPARFQQRYFVNDTQIDAGNPNTPIFIQLGGEGSISAGYVYGSLIMNEFASEHKALIVALEHRYYGLSIPNNSSDTANLVYLSSQQALADITTFIAHLRTQYSLSPSSKVITFGGSYSGALSAWARFLYPHLIQGSLAASAPIFASLDFFSYLDVVEASLGSACTAKVAAGFKAVQNLLTTQDGLTKLQSSFNICAPLSIENTKDVALFLESLTDAFASVVQYNSRASSSSPSDIDRLCSAMIQEQDDLQALIVAHQLISGPSCIDASYTNYVAGLIPTSASRSWTYQTCTEFGYYQTAEGGSAFPSQVDLAFFTDLCKDLFNLTQIDENIQRTNLLYGGKDIVTSNTVFTNGNIDPWHALGLIDGSDRGLGENSFVFYMGGTSHCADMDVPRSGDMPDIAVAHTIQRQFIQKWLTA